MKKEFTRQAMHIIGGIFFAALFLILEVDAAIAMIAIIFSLGVLVSDAHKRWNGFPFLRSILSGAERENENEVPGKAAIEFTLGMLITAIIFYNFGSTVLAGAALVLGIGDGVSTLAGKAFGKTKILGSRTLEGTAAGAIAAALALLPLFSPRLFD